MNVSLLARNIQAALSSSTFPFLRNKTQASGLIQLHMVATPPTIATQKKKDSTLCNIPLFSTMRYFTFIIVYTIHKHYKKHNLGTWLGCIESKSSWYRAKQISARLFFVLTTHSHLQLRKRESVSTNYAMITQYN